MSKIKPKYLKDGATIGVVAPASPCDKEKAEKYCRMLSRCGYNVVLGKSVLCDAYGYLAGDDELRAQDINNMFSDRSIDAVFCLRGGYGSTRIIEKLDLNLIAQNPKIFLGFSDITALHNTFNSFCGFITFHGPSVSNCEWGTRDYRFEECMRILRGGSCILKSEYSYNFYPCQAEICGGNLTLVESLIGTDYAIDAQNKIIILEDVGEKNYSIDRRLNHLRQAGYFDKCKAIVMGRFTDGDEDDINNLPLKQIIEDIIVPCGKPIICGADFGHISKNPTIPLGSIGRIVNEELVIPPCVNM